MGPKSGSAPLAYGAVDGAGFEKVPPHSREGRSADRPSNQGFERMAPPLRRCSDSRSPAIESGLGPRSMTEAQASQNAYRVTRSAKLAHIDTEQKRLARRQKQLLDQLKELRSG
eukprot:Hpha_TRINITY_DN29921_c0_g1::TRINITY_DN29921_c0_g1_i1::g.131989::m.131989